MTGVQDELMPETGADSAAGKATEDQKPEDILRNGGILKKILHAGKGWEMPETGDEVTCHYVGTLASDGSPFDSSRERGEPFAFELGLGKVIKGWDEGIRTMKRGEKALLTCRSDYAYGKAGSPPKIPAEATLNFEVELLSWKSTKDITDDGGVTKAVLTEGKDWKKPAGRDEVTVRYELRDQSTGKVLLSTGQDTATFGLDAGAGQAECRALPIAVKTMKKGEKALLVVKPAYGLEGRGVLEGEVELLSWLSVQDVKSDGGIIRKTLRETSDWNKPNPESKVVIRYTASLPDGTVFEERGEGNELRFTADEDETIPGLDIGVQEMKLAEEAQLTLAPQYAFGDQGWKGPLADVPPNSTVVYRVHLVSFEKAKEVYELETPAKLDKAQGYREAGVGVFRQGRNTRACKLWQRALKLLEHDSQYEIEDKRRSKDIKRSCYLNLAAAQLKLHLYKEASTACDKVLEGDAGSVKALYRRAQAQLALGYFIEAQQDVKAVLLQDDNNREAKALQLRIRKELAASNKKQASLYSGMFKSRPAPAASSEGAAGQPNGVKANGVAANGLEPAAAEVQEAAAAAASSNNQ